MRSGTEDRKLTRTPPSLTRMDMYLHDSATAFRFVLRGELCGPAVQELQQAWTTAQSILDGKESVVDVSGLTAADQAGLDLLLRFKQSGAGLKAPKSPKSAQLLRCLGLSLDAPAAERSSSGLLKFWRVCRARTSY